MIVFSNLVLVFGIQKDKFFASIISQLFLYDEMKEERKQLRSILK